MSEEKIMFRAEGTGERCPGCGEEIMRRFVPWLFGERPQRMPCACERRRLAEMREADTLRGMRILRDDARERAGIGGKWRRVSLSSVNPREGQEEAARILREFADAWQMDRHTAGVMLIGVPGCGKTMLAAAAANTVIDEYPIDPGHARDSGHRGIPTVRIAPVHFISTPELMATLRQEMRAERGDPAAAEERCRRAPLLVLDDLGAERLSEYGAEVLFRIVDYREREELPMLVTTNLRTPEAMRAALGERIWDRIGSMCAAVPVGCASQRILDS